MGQSAIGVMYGCLLPEGLDVYGEESDGPDLISHFQEAIGWKYESDFCPVSVEGEDEIPVIGVLVAVSGSGKDGAADLWTTQRLTELALLPETIKARETWERFVSWCRGRNVEIEGNPELWIVTTETA